MYLQEVTDLGKVHVINEAAGEALAFKRLVIRSPTLTTTCSVLNAHMSA
jgi:hypothetical protein